MFIRAAKELTCSEEKKTISSSCQINVCGEVEIRRAPSIERDLAPESKSFDSRELDIRETVQVCFGGWGEGHSNKQRIGLARKLGSKYGHQDTFAEDVFFSFRSDLWTDIEQSHVSCSRL